MKINLYKYNKILLKDRLSRQNNWPMGRSPSVLRKIKQQYVHSYYVNPKSYLAKYTDVNLYKSLFIILISTLLGPIFHLNIYIFDSNTLSIYQVLVYLCFSISLIYFISVLIGNLISYNNNNFLLKIADSFLALCEYLRVTKLSKLIVFLLNIIIIYILLWLSIMNLRNSFVYILGLESINSLQFFFLSLSILPIISYIINNFYFYLKNKRDFSLFSPFMLNSLNLSRLILFIGFFTISFYFKPLYNIFLYFGFTSILANDYPIFNLKNVNLVKPILDNELLSKINVSNKDTYLNFVDNIEKRKGLTFNLWHDISTSFYNTVTGKGLLFIESHFQSYSLAKINKYPFGEVISIEAYKALTNVNKLIYSSSKSNYMALDICNRAYFNLNPKSFSLLALKNGINCINCTKFIPLIDFNKTLSIFSPEILVYNKPVFNSNLFKYECLNKPVLNIEKVYDNNRYINDIIKNANLNLQVFTIHSRGLPIGVPIPSIHSVPSQEKLVTTGINMIQSLINTGHIEYPGTNLLIKKNNYILNVEGNIWKQI